MRAWEWVRGNGLDAPARCWGLIGGNVCGLAWFLVLYSIAGPLSAVVKTNTGGSGRIFIINPVVFLARLAVVLVMLPGLVIVSSLAAAVSRRLYWAWGALPLAISSAWVLVAGIVVDAKTATWPVDQMENPGILFLLIWVLFPGPVALYRLVRDRRQESANGMSPGEVAGTMAGEGVWPPPPGAPPEEPGPPTA